MPVYMHIFYISTRKVNLLCMFYRHQVKSGNLTLIRKPIIVLLLATIGYINQVSISHFIYRTYPSVCQLVSLSIIISTYNLYTFSCIFMGNDEYLSFYGSICRLIKRSTHSFYNSIFIVNFDTIIMIWGSVQQYWIIVQRWQQYLNLRRKN